MHRPTTPFMEVHPGSGHSSKHPDTECRPSWSASVRVSETRSSLCTYCSFALETSVGHRRRSDLPPRTARDFRFRTSEHPALGLAQ
jgi:hypothetical protein